MGLTGALLASQAILTVGQTITQASALSTQSAIDTSTAQINEEFSELQAEDAIARGEEDVVNFRKQVKTLIGSQRARLAAQGIDVESGSALEIQLDTAAIASEDVLTIRNNAFRESMGFEVSAIQFKTEAATARLRGRTERAQTILTGGLQLAEIGLLGTRLRTK